MLKSYPQPQTRGVKNRGSFGFHQRDLKRATVGRRKSYGMPKNLPTLFSLSLILFVNLSGDGGAEHAEPEAGEKYQQSVEPDRRYCLPSYH